MPEYLKHARTPPDTAPDDWSVDMERLFSRARWDAGLSYGSWIVEEINETAVVANDGPNNYETIDKAYRVKDLKGHTVVVVKSKAMAELIASIPDLCDVNLRPAPSGVVSCGITGDSRNIPFTGVSHPQAAFDVGYTRGYDEGSEVGYAKATEEYNENDEDEPPSGDSGVA